MPSPARQLMHLARRFFGHLSAKPLTPQEQDLAAAALSPELAALFFRQADPDQRHALVVAMRVRERRPADDEGFAAALLHDVGKSIAPIGAVSRAAATVLDTLRLPMPSRWRLYRQHGELGAATLTAAGATELAVAFSRHHPGPAPTGIDPEVWAVLDAADNA